MSTPDEDLVDQLVDNPLESIDPDDLQRQIENFHKKEFKDADLVTLEELCKGAKLAITYGNHIKSADAPVGGLLEKREWDAIEHQRSLRFWLEPKGLLVTLVACCMASMTQGWNQVANGNLGWPKEFGLQVNATGGGADIWKFGAVNAVLWLSAAVLGPCLLDPICHSSFFGRRGAVFIAALFSLGSTIGGSRTTSWQGYLITRIFLGIGIGAKASIVPIWESEVLPADKRGRLLITWQVFTATGIFAGSIATFIFESDWRSQVLSGGIPALILLVIVFMGCESPRWLILHKKYNKAFTTLVQLRRERVLAAEEFCYIYYQIQTERALLRKNLPLDFTKFEDHISYSQRLEKLFTLARNRRAAIASIVVMLSQQLSGINILAFFATVFFDNQGFQSTSNPVDSSLKLTIGFGASNALFSLLAYFLIEPRPNDERKKKKLQPPGWLLGRRSLLISSLAGGTVMLFVLTFLLNLDASNPAKLPVVVVFIILFTFFYSPGAGCVPFVYSAEVWPNDGREIGMSWAVFWNFLGAGFLSLFIPRGLLWGSSRLFGLFVGLSFFGLILVYLFVRPTGHGMALEDISRMFKKQKTLEFSKEKIKELYTRKKNGSAGGATNGNTVNGAGGSVSPVSSQSAMSSNADVRESGDIEMASHLAVESPSPSGAG